MKKVMVILVLSMAIGCIKNNFPTPPMAQNDSQRSCLMQCQKNYADGVRGCPSSQLGGNWNERFICERNFEKILSQCYSVCQ